MQKTVRLKNEYYCFEPNIQPDFNLVNFDMLKRLSKRGKVSEGLHGK